LAEFIEEFAREFGEVVDEIQRVLDFVGDAGGKLAERGELFRLDQPVLRDAQIVERLRQLARTRFDLLEKPHVLDGDHRLVGERLYKLDLASGERARLWTAEDEDTLDATVAQQRNAKIRAVGRVWAWVDILGIRRNVWNVLHRARKGDA